MRLETLREILISKPEYINIIQRIIEAEEKHDKNDPWLDLSPTGRGFKAEEAGIGWGHISYLISKGIITRFGSRKAKRYTLLFEHDEVKELLSKLLTIEDPALTVNEVEPGELDIPNDIFECIIGHDKIKKLFIRSLKSEKPVHILLVGAEGVAKTLFLMEVARLQGAKYYSGGGQITKAGLAEMLFEVRPKFLLIDELDEVKPADLSILLSLMETGRVTRLKHKTDETLILDTKVYAALNPWDVAKLPRDLLDRFLKIPVKPYTEAEFLEVVTKLLTTREGCDEDLAKYIADSLLKIGKRSVRDAIKIARLSETKEDVDEIIEMMGYEG